MPKTADKLGALVDAARALSGIGAPHALIGGVAVGIQAHVPRATADVDIGVHSRIERRALIAALTAARFRLTGEFRHSVTFRHASGEPVQVVMDAAMDAMIDRAERFELEGTTIPIVTKDDLIAMKQRSAADPTRRRSKQLQDLADVELLRGDVPDPDEGW